MRFKVIWCGKYGGSERLRIGSIYLSNKDLEVSEVPIYAGEMGLKIDSGEGDKKREALRDGQGFEEGDLRWIFKPILMVIAARIVGWQDGTWGWFGVGKHIDSHGENTA